MSETTTTTTDPTPEGYGFRTDATAAEVIESVEDKRAEMFGATTVPPVVNVAEDDAPAADLANEVRSFFAGFWAPPTTASLDLIILWTIGTHCRGRDARPFLMESYPLLMLGSTGPASGKSTALRLIAALAAKGEMVVDPTAPSLLNLAEDASTIALDEFDTLIGAGAGSRNMRSHLLTSYTSGGKITRAVGKGETRKVDVHYPIACAGMLRTFLTHPTLNAARTRFLTVHCQPVHQGPDAPELKRFRPRHMTYAASLREVLTAWGLAEGPRVAVTAEHITLPDGVRDRDAELWEPLFAVAECLGGDWPARALAACLEITSGQPGDDDAPKTPVEWLLRDLAYVVTADRPRMSTADVVTGLVALPDSPWVRWLDADPRNPAVSGGKQLAAMLAERDVKPRVMKIDGVAVRGFAREDLIKAGMPDITAEDTVTEEPKPVKRARKRNPAPRKAPGGPSAPITSV